MAVPQKKRTGMRRKKRVCSFCAENGETLSYKDVCLRAGQDSAAPYQWQLRKASAYADGCC